MVVVVALAVVATVEFVDLTVVVVAKIDVLEALAVEATSGLVVDGVSESASDDVWGEVESVLLVASEVVVDSASSSGEGTNASSSGLSVSLLFGLVVATATRAQTPRAASKVPRPLDCVRDSFIVANSHIPASFSCE